MNLNRKSDGIQGRAELDESYILNAHNCRTTGGRCFSGKLRPQRRKRILKARREDRLAGSLSIHRPRINIFVVYQHGLNRERALVTQEELARKLGQSFTISLSWWRLESLWHPKMCRVATEAIARADIILFSLLSGAELTHTVRELIEQQLLNNLPHRVSLLALLETGGISAPRLSPAAIYLSRLSAKAGVDCLCYRDTPPWRPADPRGLRAKPAFLESEKSHDDETHHRNSKQSPTSQ